ncbi:MAG: alpha-L-fucosidase [Bacteroidaceae bacterium]|nr:alpha-L-fucosidase [Bacteroidaceae bacterium]
MKSNILTLMFAAFICLSCSVQSEKLYEKHVVIPQGATSEEIIDIAARVVPTRNQLQWQQMELTAFLHYGINTYTDREWGDGRENPALFNPTAFDANQIVESLKAGGFKLIILTCKHHDCFCLWPSKFTEPSVKNSPYKGDVVKEISDACRKHGIKFGVYLSPWDRNAPSYGDSPEYNKYFINQLTELLTNYGEVSEVWFDGACGEGPNGKVQVYDWEAITATIHRLQPEAVTAICGDDIRWVGNESGKGRESEWNVTPLAPKVYKNSDEIRTNLKIDDTSRDLGSRDLITKADELFWYASETDVSIRPGWFYHDSQNNRVRSLKNLVDIYFSSVGSNSSLLLNVPPTLEGKVHPIDSVRLREFGDYLSNAFANNFVKDGNGVKKLEAGESITYKVNKGATINCVMLQENIAKGQRVEKFKVELLINGQWMTVGRGTTIGYKRLLRFSATAAEEVRVTIEECRRTAEILQVGLFYCPELGSDSAVAKEHISSSSWRCVGSNGKALFDNDVQSVWGSQDMQPMVVDMGQQIVVAGFTYVPSDKVGAAGVVTKYRISTSVDGESWAQQGGDREFENVVNNPIAQNIRFDAPVKARYFRFEPLESNASDAQFYTVAEFGALLK